MQESCSNDLRKVQVQEGRGSGQSDMVPEAPVADSEGTCEEAKAVRIREHNRMIHMFYGLIIYEAGIWAKYNIFKRGLDRVG